MNTSKIIKSFKEDYNIVIGEDFIPNYHGTLNIDISGVLFELHVGLNITTGKISFISMYHKTNDKNQLFKALYILKNKFNFSVTVSEDEDFSTLYLMSSEIDDESNISVKFILYDWISSIKSRYKVELRLEEE